MLVLSRNCGERVCIGDDVEVTVISVRGDRVRLGFTAPRSVSINRAEVQWRIDRQLAENSPEVSLSVAPS